MGQKKYAILRTNKIKSFQSVAGSGGHNFRTSNPGNADPSKHDLNEYLIEPENKDVNQAVHARLDALNIQPKWFGNNHKNNSVIALEIFMGTSDSFFENKSEDFKKDWVNSNQKWLEKKFGRENVVSLTLHNDETTPHLHAHVIPITPDGRLSAKELIGGHKSRHAKLQTEYHKHVEHLGLARGEPNTKRKHVELKDFYKAQQKAATRRTKPPAIGHPPIVGRKAWRDKEQDKANAYFKNQEQWRVGYTTMLNDPNIKNVQKARTERDKALGQVALEKQYNKNLRLENHRLSEEYEQWRAKHQQQVEHAQQLADQLEAQQEKNKELSRKLKQKEPEGPGQTHKPS